MRDAAWMPPLDPLPIRPDLMEREAGVEGFFAQSLQAHEGQPGLLSVSLPAPVVGVARVVEALGEDLELLWHPPGAWSLVGEGMVCARTLTGPERLQELQQWASQLFEQLRVRVHPACIARAGDLLPFPTTMASAALEGTSPLLPRLFGGLAFDVEGAHDGPWQGFGDGRFLLARWVYASDGNSACLTWNGTGTELLKAEMLQESLRQYRVWRTRLELLTHASGDKYGVDKFSTDKFSTDKFSADRNGTEKHGRDKHPPRESSRLRSISPMQQEDPPRLQVQQLPLERWKPMVEEVREAIRAGQFRKVVLARRAEVTRDTPFSTVEVLTRLIQDFPTCTIFALKHGDATFLGATPERLLRRSGSRVTTEALAGSSLSTQEDAAHQLLRSEKDLDEHRVVVEEIRTALEPYCTRLNMPETPGIRRLRHVLHLHTPIEGWLEKGVHVLELVQALHPTPAVGGVPSREALRFIRALEPVSRGWYAGPVGFFDASGDGEFWVALRSGLLRGAHAWLYAGGGIMRDSVPEKEYLETALKQRAILQALGVDV
ncbi:MAG: isochorismate synthase MenF [Myxococcota bacterium]